MRRKALLFAACFAAGCATAPSSSDTAASLGELAPVRWSENEVSIDPQAAVEPYWWRSFGDSRLDRLIEIVGEQNRELRSAGARVDLALAQARIAGAELEPTAGLAVDGSRRRQNFIGLPIPGAEGGVLSNTSTSLGASLNVSWEVDLWGRLRAGRQAAIRRVEASRLDHLDAGLSIAGQTTKAWFAFLEARAQVALALEIEENRARVRQRIERRYRSGLRTALDLRLAIASQANATAALAARKRVLDSTRRQLDLLSGRDAEVDELLASLSSQEVGLPKLPKAPSPSLPVEVLRRRPDVRASEERLAAAGLDVRAARRLLYPQLTLAGTTGRSSNELEDLTDSSFSIWSLAAGILQPLFQGGRLRAGVAASEAVREDLLARHETAVIRALVDVESQLAAETLLAEQYDALAAGADASTAARDLAQDRYFAGLSSYLEVLSAEASATSASSQLLEIERRRLEHRVDLYLALGVGAQVPASHESTTLAAVAAPQPNSEVEP